MTQFLKTTVAFLEVILYITGFFTADTTINYGGNEYIAQEISEPMTIIETANLSWEYYKANQFLDKYTILNPFRHKRIEELYDSMKAHGINEVSGFQEIPPKEDINFMQRPYNWG